MPIIPKFIGLLENGFNMLLNPGTSVAETDEKFYGTKQLSPEERRQAMALLAMQDLPEGSICVIRPGKQKNFDVVPDLEKEKEEKSETDWSNLSGRKRAGKIVGEKFLKNSEWARIDTVVIPGCGSSPLGAAALGKTLANMYEPKEGVAAIVAGQGAFDMWMEASSGGMLMAPMATALNAFHPFLKNLAKTNRIKARDYILELLDTIHEAATLYELLEARLLAKDKFDHLRMIVSHSKGNWAVLTALLAIELEHGETLAEKYKVSHEFIKPIDIVTFGNPVDLPDMNPIMSKLFHYFQFIGENDVLGHNCSMVAWHFHLTGVEKLDPDAPVLLELRDPNRKPVEKLEKIVARTGHHLAHSEEFKTHHMPIEEILRQIRPTATY